MNKKQWFSIITAGWLAAFPAWAFDAFIIEGIEVQGLQRITEGTVYNYLPLSVGDKITVEDTPHLIRELFKTGFFKNIELAKSGNNLVVQLQERPAIGKIKVKGNEAIPTDKLNEQLKSIGLAEGHTFDPSVLERMETELERLYFSQGKYAVKVAAQVTELPRNRVSIELNIEEGYFARIKDINIIGNHSFTKAELLKIFTLTQPNYISWLTRSDQYDKLKLSKDLENLRNFYLDRGYLNFKVHSTQVSITPNKQDIYITVNLEEDAPYQVSEVEIIGRTRVPETELQAMIDLTPGENFSRSKVAAIVKAISDKLGDCGYAFAKVNPVPELDEVQKQVKLSIYIEPGQKVHVRRINFVGNSKTQDQVLRLNMLQLEAAPLSTTKIEASRARLLRSGLLKEATVETRPVPGIPDQVDVIFTVEELSAGQLGGGIGYSDVDGLVFNANVSNQNVFGSGKSTDLNFNRSKAYTTYSLSYDNPYYTIDGISRGFNLYNSKTDLGKTTTISDYTTDAYGGNVNYGIPLSEFNRLTIGLGVQHTTLGFKDYSKVPNEIDQFVKQHDVKSNEVNLALGWVHNSLDRPMFPEKGISHALGLSMSAPGSHLQYYRLTYNAQWYRAFSKHYIGMLSTSLGYGDGYGKTDSLPFYKNFYGGGARSIRGFRESSLGPKDSLGNPFGGNFMLSATAMLIFPDLILPSSQAFRSGIFFDVGQVYTLRNKHVFNHSEQRFIDRNPKDLSYSVGVSVTWRSPMAPIVMSLGFPLNKKQGDKEKIVQFTFGTLY